MECLKLARENGFENVVAISLSNIGQIYLIKEDYDKAEDFLREGLAAARKTDARNTIMQNLLMHARLFACRHDFERAFEYFLKYDEYKSEFLDAQALQRVHELEMKFDLERKEHEAEIYRLRSEELEAKNTALEEANGKLRAAQEEIRQLERRNSVFAMAVTTNHEMNQPLMIIQGNLDMLESDIDLSQGKAAHHLQRVRESLARINELLARYR